MSAHIVLWHDANVLGVVLLDLPLLARNAYTPSTTRASGIISTDSSSDWTLRQASSSRSCKGSTATHRPLRRPCRWGPCQRAILSNTHNAQSLLICNQSERSDERTIDRRLRLVSVVRCAYQPDSDTNQCQLTSRVAR
jgi:hypothetical protein